MKEISARHTADLLDAASRNIRSSHNREKTGLTPKKAASWIMTLVIDLEQADVWSAPPCHPVKDISK